MDLGLFMMPLHPPENDRTACFEEDLAAISLHHLDVWLNQRWLGLHYATALEWGGLLVIGVGLVIGLWPCGPFWEKCPSRKAQAADAKDQHPSNEVAKCRSRVQ